MDMFGALDRCEHADYLVIGNAGHYLDAQD
jgi:hypothetical protein